MDSPESPTHFFRARRRLHSPKSWWSKRRSQDSTDSRLSLDSESKPRKSCATELIRAHSIDAAGWLKDDLHHHHNHHSHQQQQQSPQFRQYQQTNSSMSSPETSHGSRSRSRSQSRSRTNIDAPHTSPSPRSPIPKAISLLSRRSAKSIMLGKPKSGSRSPQPTKKRASVELIAEQYRMMLDYRERQDEGFVYLESQAVPEMPLRRKQFFSPQLPRLEAGMFDASPTPIYPDYQDYYDYNDMYDHPRETLLDAPRQIDPPEFSPRSDTTLVSFEEDAIYFKPVSFESPPPSPIPDHHRSLEDLSPFPFQSCNQSTNSSAPPSICVGKELPPPPSSESLQAGMSMLTKELSSSMAGNVSDLQLSVMIQAYERLRFQAAESGQGEVTSMFDCWLGALKNVHGSMATDGGL